MPEGHFNYMAVSKNEWDTINNLLNQVQGCETHLTRTRGDASPALWDSPRRRESKPIVQARTLKENCHYGTKGSLAQLACEYGPIKLALSAWPNGLRLFRMPLRGNAECFKQEEHSNRDVHIYGVLLKPQICLYILSSLGSSEMVTLKAIGIAFLHHFFVIVFLYCGWEAVSAVTSR